MRIASLIGKGKLRPVPKAPSARRPPGANPAGSVFAIRVGPSGARRFLPSLARIDSTVREILGSEPGQSRLRPVATVILPEAIHLVVCGQAGEAERLGRRLAVAVESIEAGERSGEPERFRSESPNVDDPLRLSILRTGGLVSTAGVVLGLPRARGLVGSGVAWPWSRSGEA
jgi:hypothetical protein